MRTKRNHLTVLLLVFSPLMFLFAGCGDDNDPIKPLQVQNLPARFRVIGEASRSEPDGRTVRCSLDFIFELRGENSRTRALVEYRGFHGGEVIRRIQKQDGSGFFFNAESGGDIVAKLMTDAAKIELILPLNETTDNPFWHNLARFPGSVYPTGFGSGTWTCAPLDIEQGGYVDTDITVAGQWRMEPIN